MGLKGKNLANFINKYSDSEISYYFFKYANSSTQISVEYHLDILKKKKLINYIVDRHIQYRDALTDPSNPMNARIIMDHRKYFHDPNDKANGQIRGPQCDLADKMFFKAAIEGNGIENTNLSGVFLGNLNTENTHNVLYPSTLNIASPCSFKQGIELCNAKILSSAMGHQVIYTNDDLSNLPKGQSMVNNMPANQTICDYLRIVPIVPSNSITPAISSNFAFLQEDDKKRTLNSFLNKSSVQQNVSVGTIDPQEEKNAVINLAKARLAIMGVLPTQHVDPSKNKDVNLILKKIEKTGKIEDARELLKFPLILSNRHVDS